MNIKHWHLSHVGGTKDYTVWWVPGESGSQGFVITRWGKVGSAGQSDIQSGSSQEAARAVLAKERRGYFIKAMQTFDLESPALATSLNAWCKAKVGFGKIVDRAPQELVDAVSGMVKRKTLSSQVGATYRMMLGYDGDELVDDTDHEATSPARRSISIKERFELQQQQEAARAIDPEWGSF